MDLDIKKADKITLVDIGMCEMCETITDLNLMQLDEEGSWFCQECLISVI